MPHEPATSPATPGIVLCALLAGALTGCSLMSSHRTPLPPPPVDSGQPTTTGLLSTHLIALQHLIQAPAADQPELFAAAQKDFEVNPSPDHQLRYALMLATPGHRGTNPERAEQLLLPLATVQKGALDPAEQALAIVALQDVQRAIALNHDNQRLTQSQTDRSERERSVANNRRLQQTLDENAKLRKDLEDARAKLDAITSIERGDSRPAAP